MFLPSSYKLRCTHVPGVLISHESWESLGRWKVAGHPQGTECRLTAGLTWGVGMVFGYLRRLVWKPGLLIFCRDKQRTPLLCVPLTPRTL